MEALPMITPRTPTGPMGCLNYPPEIMNKIYQELFVDERQILSFLCSTDPAFHTIDLKKAVNEPPNSSREDLDWSQLYDTRYYIDSNGLSAQFLRVCTKTWREGSSVLYGNLKIAMRWTPKPDPCIVRFFKRNAHYVLVFANVIYPRSNTPLPTPIEGWTPLKILHWGVTHPPENWDLDRQTLRRMRAERLSGKCRRILGGRERSATF